MQCDLLFNASHVFDNSREVRPLFDAEGADVTDRHPFLLIEELPMPSVGPRVVLRGEVGASFYGGVAVFPELDEWTGVGVFKPGFAESVESGHGGLSRVGDEAVDG